MKKYIERELERIGESALAKKLVTSRSKKIGKYLFEQSDDGMSYEPTIYRDDGKVIFLGYGDDWDNEVALLEIGEELKQKVIRKVPIRRSKGGITIKDVYDAVKKIEPGIPFEGVMFCLIDKPLETKY